MEGWKADLVGLADCGGVGYAETDGLFEELEAAAGVLEGEPDASREEV